jgi:hypothetical protein
MIATITIDTRPFSQALVLLASAAQRAESDVLRQQARLLVKDCARMTPPCGRSALTESYAQQRRTGLKALARDVKRVFQPMENTVKGLNTAEANSKPGFTGEPVGTRALRYARTGQLDKLNELLKHFKFRRRAVKDATVALFKSARTISHRTRTINQRFVVTNPRSIAAATKAEGAEIGKAKAGWVRAAEALGEKLPSWILKHRSPGLYVPKLTGPVQSITVGNLVDYIQEAGASLKIIQRGLDRRVKAMQATTVAAFKRRLAQWV